MLGFVGDTDSLLRGQVDFDGAFELGGDLTQEGGPMTIVTFTGRVTGSSMSGNFTREWPDGCVGSGTFSGGRSS